MTITTATTLTCDLPGCESHITAPSIGQVLSRRVTNGWAFRYLDGNVTHICPQHQTVPSGGRSWTCRDCGAETRRRPR